MDIRANNDVTLKNIHKGGNYKTLGNYIRFRSNIVVEFILCCREQYKFYNYVCIHPSLLIFEEKRIFKKLHHVSQGDDEHLWS